MQSSQSPVSLQSSDVTAPPNCTTQLEALCVCLEHIGDNGDCVRHGPAPVIWTQKAEDAAWAKYDAATFAYQQADSETRPAAWIALNEATQALLKVRRAWYHRGL
jgi:hypothetical protein